MRRVMLIGLAALAMGGLACSDGNIGDVQTEPSVSDPNADAVANLVLDEHTDTRVAGRLRTADGDLSFVATFVAARLSVSVTVNGKHFDASKDGATTTIDGHDAVLTDADKN